MIQYKITLTLLYAYPMTHHDIPTHSHHGNIAMLPRTQMALQVIALGGGVAPLFILVQTFHTILTKIFNSRTFSYLS